MKNILWNVSVVVLLALAAAAAVWIYFQASSV